MTEGTLIMDACSKTILPINKERLEEVKLFIDTHLNTKLNTDSIAQKFSYSKSTLSRHFLIVFKISMRRYILDCKMQKAHLLLAKENKSISEAGILVGYSKSSAFTHAFVRYFGYPPIHLFRTENAVV